MNQYFDESKISELFPGAEALMVPAGLIWKLPAGKEHMMSEVCESGDYFAEEKIDGAFYMFVTGSGHGSTLDAQQSYLFGRTVSKVTGLMTRDLLSWWYSEKYGNYYGVFTRRSN